MPSSLTYSLSGSEGGRSSGGPVDLDNKSLVGIDLTTTPGTTPVKRKTIKNATSLVENNCVATVQDLKSRGASGVAQRSSRSGSDQVSYGEDMARRLSRRTLPMVSPAVARVNHTGGVLEGQTMDAAGDEPDLAHVLVEDEPNVHKREEVEVTGHGGRSERVGAALQDNADRDNINVGEDANSHPGKADFDEGVLEVNGGLKNSADCQKQTAAASFEGTPGDFDPKSSAILAKPDIASHEVGIVEDHVHELADRCHSDNLSTEQEGRVKGRCIESSYQGDEFRQRALENPREGCALNGSTPSTIIRSQAPAGLSFMDKRQSFDDGSCRRDMFKREQSPSANVGGVLPLVMHEGDSLPKCEEGREALRATECCLDERNGEVQVGPADRGPAKSQEKSQHQDQRRHSLTAEHGTVSTARITIEKHVEAEAGVERHGFCFVHSAQEAVSPDGVKHDETADFPREPQSPPPLSRSSGRQLADPHAEKSNGHQEAVATVRRASEHLNFSQKESLAFRATLDEPTTPPIPGKQKPAKSTLSMPNLSPTPSTSPSEYQSHQVSSPRSPVAIAARALSHEESMRSTVRMQKAAKVIALEDERMYMESRELGHAALEENQGHRETALRKKSVQHEIETASHTRRRSMDDERMESDESDKSDERTRFRTSKASAPRRNDEPERDRALDLTLQVLQRKGADKVEGLVTVGHRSKAGKRDMHSSSRRSKPPQTRLSEVARRIKDPAARSCGLSTTQVVLLERSRELEAEKHTPRKANPQQTERLAQPKAKRPETRTRNPATEALVKELTRSMNEKDKRAFLYACLADAKECTHSTHPRSLAQRRGERVGGRIREYDEEKKQHGVNAFLYRVDAQEKAKQAAMEHRRGELEYNATLDKRVCPSCDAEQSHEEVREGRKVCPNCNVEYRKPRTWAGVRKDFMKRMRKFEESRRAYLEATARRKESQAGHRLFTTAAAGDVIWGNSRMIRFVKQAQTLTLRRREAPEHEMKEQLFWEDIEGDFISRLQEDLAKREASRGVLAKTVGNECTFQPKLSAASKRLLHDSAWAEMNFLERLNADLQRRKDATLAIVDDEYLCRYSSRSKNTKA